MDDETYDVEVSENNLIFKRDNEVVLNLARKSTAISGDNSVKQEIPLQAVMFNDKTADIVYSFEGDTKPVSCEIGMGGYSVVLNDFGDGYQCSICSIEGMSSTVVADCAYHFDGNSIVFNIDMSSFKDFSFGNIAKYETLVSFGEGGGLFRMLQMMLLSRESVPTTEITIPKQQKMRKA